MEFRIPREIDWLRGTSRYGGLEDAVVGRAGLRGLGVYSNADLPAKAQTLKTLDGQIAQLAASLQSSMQSYGSALESSPDAGLIQKASDALAAFSSISSELQGAAARVGPYGSFQESDAAGKSMDEVEARARGVLTTWSSLPSQLQAAGRRAIDAVRAAQAAQVAAQQAAATQRERDIVTVNGALSRAAAAQSRGDLAGAEAILKSAGLMEAATRIGRADDVDGALQAVAFARGQQERQTAAQTAAEAARAASGTKVDSMIAQAQGLAASGNFTGALAALASVAGLANQLGRGDEIQFLQSQFVQAQADAKVAQAQQAAEQREASRVAAISARVDAALQSANSYAASGSYDVALNVLNAIMGDAVQAGRAGDVAAAQASIADAKAQSGGRAPGAPAPIDPVTLEYARRCADQGGRWDGTSQTCDLSEVFARKDEQAEFERKLRSEERQQGLVMQLLPLAAGNPDLLLALIQTLVPGVKTKSMAEQVPGERVGDVVLQKVPGPYSNELGDERF